MEFLLDYAAFLLKAATVVIAIVVVLMAIVSLGARRAPKSNEGYIEIAFFNDRLRDWQHAVSNAGLSSKAYRKVDKAERKQRAANDKTSSEQKPRVYVVRFEGDIRASQVEALRREITAVLTAARAEDEVVAVIDSPGGEVSSYGLAASQLARVRQRSIPLTVAVDRVAASGGYLMAVVANRILAAPFALVGSIGVAAEIPNVHRLLRKFDVEYDVFTAGEHKRPVTVFGENTEAGRAKLQEELDDVHSLFREFVGTYRPAIDVSKIATGEAWMGQRAKDLALIDELTTSDEYLAAACERAEVFEVKWVQPKRPLERVLGQINEGWRQTVGRIIGSIK